MATRIAKGTAKAKALGNILTISGISLNSGASLVVASGYDDIQGHPVSVKWGQRELKRRRARNPSGIDIAGSVWTVGSVRDTATKDVVITWAGNINERAAVVVSVEGANKIDKAIGNNQSVATTAPTTGLSAPLTETNNFVLAFMIAEGPDTNDTPSAPEIGISGNFVAATLGQRIGTNGAPAADNVTVQEIYHQLIDACDGIEVRMTNSTARKFVSMAIVMETLSVYLMYYSAGKCSTCSDVVWCDNDINSVTCICGDGTLNPDGTFTGNIVAVTDQELKDAARPEITGGNYDDVELVNL